jgi:16S rRNA (cytidine1402-2'-O)-methyltransferase
MTPRAVQTLKSVECIAAEDTRHSAPLLQHFMIQTPTLSLHEHNEREKTSALLERLQQGESIALISDAGTPLINDPGFFLVREAREMGIKVVPIPGSCAIIAALSVSGLPTDKFCYEGFLPAKSRQRLHALETLCHETRTMIFYEAPHRVLESLQDMQTIFGANRQAVLARELTKLYETVLSGTLSSLIEQVKNDANQQRGEIVLMVKGADEKEKDSDALSIDSVLIPLLAELPLKQAVELTIKITGKRKNEIYQRALEIK